MWYYIIITLIMLPVLLLFRVKKVGKQNLKKLKGQTYIVVCNHMSNWDPILLDVLFNKKHWYLAKKELFDKKLKANIMRGVGAVAVDRKKPEPSSIKQIFSLIKKGKTIAIFPQGTRAKTIKIEGDSAKEGAAMFAVRTNTPIVPMMFTGKAKMFRRIKLLIGEPIYPDASKARDKDYISEFSDEIINKLNALIDNDTKTGDVLSKDNKMLKKDEFN